MEAGFVRKMVEASDFTCSARDDAGQLVYTTAERRKIENDLLLEGTVQGRAEPIAWVRMAGESRVFYTSMGHPADFDDPLPHFRTLLLNGIRWALGEH